MTIINSQNIYYLLHYFFIFSFLGWLMETCLCSYNAKSYVNRGFLNGPVCPIYGAGMCLIIIFLTGFTENLFLLFIGGFLFATTLEYFVGYLLEKLFNAKWWDYSQKPFNIHGRICLTISMCWGLLSVVMMRLVVPFINLFIEKIDILWGWIYLSAFSAIIIMDTAITVYHMYGLNRILNELTRIKGEMKHQFELTEDLVKNTAEEYKFRLTEISDTEFENYKAIIEKMKSRMDSFTADFRKDSRFIEISQTVSDLRKKYAEQIKRPNKVHKRLLKAYPNMKANKNYHSLQEIRSELLELKEKIKSKINRD